MEKTSILADTLLEVKQLRKTIEDNANHALKTTLKEELEDIVRRGLADDNGEEAEDEFGSEEVPSEDGVEGTGEEMPDDLGSEEPGEEVIDLTGQPDEEVLKTFELMEPADEIEIIRTEDGISINFKQHEEGEEPEGEFSSEEEPEGETELGSDNPEEDDEDGIYEIEIEESEEGEEKGEGLEEVEIHSKSLQHMRKSEPQEINEKLVSTRKKLQVFVNENKSLKNELASLKELTNEFKANENDYKEALKVMKTQLNEVSLFTSNLTYAIKLITENSTTKDEKFNILNKFDKVKTLNESKETYNLLQEQFTTGSKKSPEEVINEKVIDKTSTAGSSTINESKAFVSPQVQRMKELMSKI